MSPMSMSEPPSPWWKQVDQAAQLLASEVNAAVARAERDGVYTPPPSSPAPKRRRQPGSLRHLAEVIRSERLAPGLSVDKDDVAAVLAGKLRQITDPVLVVAVARAGHLIAGAPFTAADGERLTVACARVAALAEAARQADEQAPRAVPAPIARKDLSAQPKVVDAYFTTRRPRRRWLPIARAAGSVALAGAGALLVLEAWGPGAHSDPKPVADAGCWLDATGDDILADTPARFADDRATRLSPTLDFDQMNGSARYDSHAGRIYYWGRAGSDDHDPHAGGVRVRWRVGDGRWHSCATTLSSSERGYVHTPAVATTIGGRAVTLQVCLWRDDPRRENCTDEISTGR